MDFRLFSDSGVELGVLGANGVVGREMLDRAGKVLSIRGFVPYVGAAGYWHPDLPRLAPMKLPWVEEFVCGANSSFPFWCLMGQSYRNCAAVGLTNVTDDCRVRTRMNQEAGGYELSFDIAVDPSTAPFRIYVDMRPLPLEETVAAFRRLLMPQAPCYPCGAWEPVYCTWYAAHTVLSKEFLEENARLARQLGFGTFIVDDGWCLDEDKRVTPATLPTWYEWIGDWRLSEKKLPRMKSTIRKAHADGWNYMFWVAPFFVGDRSGLRRRTNAFLTESHEGERLFDPADAEASRITMESIMSIFREMDLDGLKIDFIDAIAPDERRPHARAVMRYVTELVKRIRAEKPDALIEFRQNYGTPATAGLATAFRAGDVPFDYVENFQRCIQLRLLLGDGVPVHADPIYFRADEIPGNIARHLMASMAGVPMLSMDLRGLSAEQLSIIANYLAVYRKWQKTLNFGHWEFRFSFGHTAWARCRGEQGTVVFLWEKELLEQALENVAGSTVVLNLSDEELGCAGMTAYDETGAATGSFTARVGGRLERP